jgi:hypothetical protein
VGAGRALAPDWATSLHGPAHNKIVRLRPIISARFNFLKLNSMVIGQSARQRSSGSADAAPLSAFLTASLLTGYESFRVCKTLANCGTLRRGKSCVVERHSNAARRERW